MRTPLVALVVLALGIAGCLKGDDVEPADAASTGAQGVEIVSDRPEPTMGEVVLGESAKPDENATLAAMPRLVEGEWWKIEMMSPIDGRTASYVRVMAEDTGSSYVFGMPHEGWYKEAVIYHVPFFGDVEYDLSGHAHDIPFQPLKFPLTDESTWKTKFEGGPDLTATVKTNQAEQTAVVTFKAPNGDTAVELTYDAKVHEIVDFKQSTIEYKVVDHGYGFQGWVTVPRGEDLVFLHGRIGAPVVGISPFPSPSTPTDTVEINGGFNRVTFIVVAGGGSAFLGLPADPGAFKETVNAPDGTKYELQQVGPGMKIEFYENSKPDGKWTMEHIAAGAGVAFVEGIAYHQYDIRLPDGAKRSDHSHEVVR